MRPEVRPCRESDLQAITDLENWAIRETVAHFGREPIALADTQAAYSQAQGTHVWLVAHLDGRFAGFARSTPWKARESYRHTCELGVYVTPEFHGQGVAKALYTELFPALKELGFNTILAGVTLPNEPSVRLQESFGMTRCATLPDVGFKFDQWHSVGYWAKSIR
jgi:phosphinothricin acetyltransferase